MRNSSVVKWSDKKFVLHSKHISGTYKCITKLFFFFYLFCILSNTSISKICLKWYVSAKIYLEIWRIQNIFCEKYLFQPCCLQHQILWTTIFISFYFILAYSLFAILALKSLVLPPLTHSCFLSIFIFRFAQLQVCWFLCCLWQPNRECPSLTCLILY